MSKRLRRWILILGAVLVFAILAFKVIDKPLPEGKVGKEAEALADKMLRVLNKKAWDTTYVVKWSFYRGHDYLWDRKNDLVQVIWDDYEVLLNTNTLQGIAFENDRRLNADASEEALKKAWEYFANDSFWLIAPYKVRDPGTERAVVNVEGKDALLVYYASGGVTPGDSYLWHLSEDGTPKAWQLWVNILPVGGIKFTWENWKTFSTGARISLLHQGPFEMEISNVEVATSIEELTGGTNPFNKLNF